jgi:hypothetical protein
MSCPDCAKPLFIPLAGKHYDRFADGTKDTEYRSAGPRWNEKTVFEGRKVTLSRGYGKKHRLSGVVESSVTLSFSHLPSDVQRNLLDLNMVGADIQQFICIKIRLSKGLSS